jgi:hypothetical protein
LNFEILRFSTSWHCSQNIARDVSSPDMPVACAMPVTDRAVIALWNVQSLTGMDAQLLQQVQRKGFGIQLAVLLCLAHSTRGFLWNVCSSTFIPRLTLSLRCCRFTIPNRLPAHTPWRSVPRHHAGRLCRFITLAECAASLYHFKSLSYSRSVIYIIDYCQ